jgi:hypothetical protein
VCQCAEQGRVGVLLLGDILLCDCFRGTVFARHWYGLRFDIQRFCLKLQVLMKEVGGDLFFCMHFEFRNFYLNNAHITIPTIIGNHSKMGNE